MHYYRLEVSWALAAWISGHEVTRGNTASLRVASKPIPAPAAANLLICPDLLLSCRVQVALVSPLQPFTHDTGFGYAWGKMN